MTTNAGDDGTGTITAIIYAYGGAVVSNDGTKVVLNSLETLAVVQFLADVYTNPDYRYALPPGSDGWKDMSNDEAWLTGTVGITRNAYTLYVQSFADKNPVYDQTAILAGFTGPGTDQVIATPGAGYLAVPKGAKNSGLAMAAALHLAGGRALLEMAKPSLGLILPAYKDCWNADPFYTQGNPSFLALRQIIEGRSPVMIRAGYTFPQSPSPIYEHGIRDQHILNDMMGDIVHTGTKVRDAVKAAFDRLVQVANQFGLPQ